MSISVQTIRLYTILAAVSVLTFIVISGCRTTKGIDRLNDKRFSQQKELLTISVDEHISYYTAEHKRLSDEMETLVEEAYLDRVLIFGPEDRYFKKGMHKNWVSPPKIIEPKTYFSRNPKVVQLEKSHVDLHYVDYELIVWEDLMSILDSLQIKQLYIDNDKILSNEAFSIKLMNESILPLSLNHPNGATDLKLRERIKELDD